MSVKNKQNSSVNFLVRAKLLIRLQRRDNIKHYKHSDSIGDV